MWSCDIREPDLRWKAELCPVSRGVGTRTFGSCYREGSFFKFKLECELGPSTRFSGRAGALSLRTGSMCLIWSELLFLVRFIWKVLGWPSACFRGREREALAVARVFFFCRVSSILRMVCCSFSILSSMTLEVFEIT